MMAKRCSWVTNDPLYINYHDNEWGYPQYDSLKLFEKICLEGQQAGLSWITVLKKREEYRRCFFNFDPEKIIQLNAIDIESLIKNKGLIRNRLKLNSIIKNAHAYLAMQNNNEDFSQFIWSFVDGKPIVNHYKDKSEVPVSTEISDKMSKALKKKGFSFVGSTICYAFMQSMGLVNDHFEDCFKK
ncbi:DNA-3-methyladenine glycosylase I [Gilliamella sp. B3486]|nr:DNA-3-methyladenine glycosylase I [Gilliamella sp. B3493]MCX8598691.1 DNA-3-methyladenine glycosylase I [Gilliamella sp. B3486]MCX8689301.1 DNA-3-methyladenine glycosylase I [Gilliamella sp. B2973]MCX8705003.1 DNA-3-methyladenine glycosylase I [Gilliamella sp. B3127]